MKILSLLAVTISLTVASHAEDIPPLGPPPIPPVPLNGTNLFASPEFHGTLLYSRAFNFEHPLDDGTGAVTGFFHQRVYRNADGKVTFRQKISDLGFKSTLGNDISNFQVDELAIIGTNNHETLSIDFLTDWTNRAAPDFGWTPLNCVVYQFQQNLPDFNRDSKWMAFVSDASSYRLTGTARLRLHGFVFNLNGLPFPVNHNIEVNVPGIAVPHNYIFKYYRPKFIPVIDPRPVWRLN